MAGKARWHGAMWKDESTSELMFVVSTDGSLVKQIRHRTLNTVEVRNVLVRRGSVRVFGGMKEAVDFATGVVAAARSGLSMFVSLVMDGGWGVIPVVVRALEDGTASLECDPCIAVEPEGMA